MKKNYLFVIALLCVSVFALQAKEIPTRVGLKSIDARSGAIMQKAEHLLQLNPVQHRSSHSLKAPASTDASVVLLDSVVTKTADGTYFAKTINGYDARGNRILTNVYSFNSETQQWTPTQQYEYGYNALNEQSLTAYYLWDAQAGGWQVSYRIETDWSVDLDGNKNFVRVRKDWDDETLSLKNTSKEETVLQGNTNYYLYRTNFTVDEQGNWLPTNRLEQINYDDGNDYSLADFEWSSDKNKWRGISKEGYKNSADDSYMEFLTSYFWDDESWDWSSKTEVEYDWMGNDISATNYNKNGESWQPISKEGKDGDFTVYYTLTNSTFVMTHKDNINYDSNGNLSDYTRYDWNGSDWYLSKHIGLCAWDNLSGEWRIFQYIEVGNNENNQELYRIQLVRDNSQSDWVPYYTYKTENTYNNEGRQTVRILNSWAGGEPTEYIPNENGGEYRWTFTWNEERRTTYFYSEHDITDKVPSYEVSTQFYPNPARDYLTIKGTKAGQSIHIRKLNGQSIGTYPAEESTTVIPLTALIPGVYLVNIDNYSVKIVKE